MFRWKWKIPDPNQLKAENAQKNFEHIIKILNASPDNFKNNLKILFSDYSRLRTLINSNSQYSRHRNRFLRNRTEMDEFVRLSNFVVWATANSLISSYGYSIFNSFVEKYSMEAVNNVFPVFSSEYSTRILRCQNEAISIDEIIQQKETLLKDGIAEERIEKILEDISFCQKVLTELKLHEHSFKKTKLNIDHEKRITGKRYIVSVVIALLGLCVAVVSSDFKEKSTIPSFEIPEISAGRDSLNTGPRILLPDSIIFHGPP